MALGLLAALICSGSSGAQMPTTSKYTTIKQRAMLWYEAFNRKDPSILDDLLDPFWVDVPSGPVSRPRIIRTWHTEDWMSGLRQLDAVR